MDEAEDLVGFQPFVGNLADPLAVFSDAAMHRRCYEEHPLRSAVDRRLDEMGRLTTPWPPCCRICGERIGSPEEFRGLGHLTDDPSDAAFFWNYAHFHASCMAGWSELSRLRSMLEEIDRSGRWAGPAIRDLLEWIPSE
jgi:hypothetical protein